jgi:hypothetical protein
VVGSGDGVDDGESDAVALAPVTSGGQFLERSQEPPGLVVGWRPGSRSATTAFDRIDLEGANSSWRRDDVGVEFEEDGRTPHHPGGAVESGGRIVVTGGGDIGPATATGGLRADLLLIGGAVGLIPVLVAAVAFGAAERRRGPSTRRG